MADRELTLLHSGETGQRTGESALLWARSLLLEHKREEARHLLISALETETLEKVSDRAAAMLALAILAQQDGDLGNALGLLSRAEKALVLSEAEWELVRWDLLLGRALTLSQAGRIAESAACARTALALFNDSGHSVAWHRLMLLDLDVLSRADGDETGAFLLPKALGVLHLRDGLDVDRWLHLQVSVFRELVERDNVDTAIQHASLVLCALPADILGDDVWWNTLMKSLGWFGEAAHGAELRPIIEAFEILEWEYEFGGEHERNAPLLPRKRMVMRP